MKEQGNVCLRLKANVSSDVSDPETRIDRVEVRPRRMGELATGFLSFVARVAQYAKFGTVYNNLLDDRTTIESISVLSKALVYYLNNLSTERNGLTTGNRAQLRNQRQKQSYVGYVNFVHFQSVP